MTKILFSIVMMTCSALACGGKAEPAAAGAPAGGTPAAAPSEGSKELKLSNGLTVTAPGDAKESAMGAAIAVSALGGRCMAMIGEKTDVSPSLENLLKNIEAGHKGGALKEVTRKEQKGPDDFIVEWTTDKKFGYASRRTVGGKNYFCDRVSANAEAHACVVAICESLK